MLSDEEKEIFKNLKEYMQNNINNGYHKFVYNDLDWDFKCIDCINAIDKVLKQSKEIEELNKENTRQHELIGNIHQKWKDKIKARIEELEGFLYKGNIKDDFLMIRIKAKIQELQSLLEKE